MSQIINRSAVRVHGPASADSICKKCRMVFSRIIQSSLDHSSDVKPYSARIPHSSYLDFLSTAKKCHMCAWLSPDTYMRIQGDFDWKTTSPFLFTGNDYNKIWFRCLFVIIRSLPSGKLSLSIETPDGLEFYGAWTATISRIEPEHVEAVLASRRAFPDLLSPNTTLKIKSWLSECLSKHKPCSTGLGVTPQSNFRPTRLLEISGNGQQLRLRTTNTLTDKDPYLTLSHCWGYDISSKLTRANFQAHHVSIALDSLPRTFREAIRLVHNLGYKYLWIDALCIIQDCPEDRPKEASRMADVYACGLLNLSASASRHCEEGLFHSIAGNEARVPPGPPAFWSRVSPSPCILNFRGQDDQIHPYLVHYRTDELDRVDDSPLNSRAWVVQERLLSPRTVHFTWDEPVWECFCTMCSEWMPEAEIGPNRKMEALQAMVECAKGANPYHLWQALVKYYSTKQLSFQEDKLVALSGLASRFALWTGLGPSQYLAGLWAGNLIEDLCWGRIGDGNKSSADPSLSPSWSWAHVVSDAKGIDFFLGGCAPAFSIAAVSRQDSPYLFGQVLRGSISIAVWGPLYEVEMTDVEPYEHFWKYWLAPRTHDIQPIRFTDSMVQWDDCSDKKYRPGVPFFWLICMHALEPFGPVGLLLQPTLRKHGQFERVGVLQRLEPLQYIKPIDTSFIMGYRRELGYLIELV